MMGKHSTFSSAAVTVYLMYLLTGAACTVLGASLNSVMTQYGLGLSRAAGLASCLAIGRIATVFFSGMLTERIGSTKTLTIGVCAMLAYLALIPRLSSYPAAVMLAVIAGIGQGMQDSSCPVLLKRVFPDTYSSALGASQFFFGAGCFLPPAIMTFLLLNNLSWHWMYYVFGVLAVSIVSLVPFIPSSYNTKREEIGRSKPSHFGRELSEKGLMTFFLLCISIFTYCATTSIIHTYTPVYIMSFNIEEASAVSVLTIFSVGSMIGSLFFTWFLRKHEG
jgi:MFS family permease